MRRRKEGRQKAVIPVPVTHSLEVFWKKIGSTLTCPALHLHNAKTPNVNRSPSRASYSARERFGGPSGGLGVHPRPFLLLVPTLAPKDREAEVPCSPRPCTSVTESQVSLALGNSAPHTTPPACPCTPSRGYEGVPHAQPARAHPASGAGKWLLSATRRIRPRRVPATRARPAGAKRPGLPRRRRPRPPPPPPRPRRPVRTFLML
jgi:hypothetical protein